MPKLALMAAALLAAFAPAASNAAPPRGQATPLTSVGVVSDPDAPPDPDDPGTGGAFDAGAYFQDRLTSAAAIAACAAKIEAVASAWAKKYALTETERDPGVANLTLIYVKAGLQGVFEVTYKVELGTRARVTLNFFAQDGRALEPAAIQSFITDYGVGALEDGLHDAVGCGGHA
jgi:hypothetical protein